ncbi:MAG: glycosyltransferase family 4 protein [Chthoniobacterales bacterium]|nr:glycosyltransferase family 4 protein [Chthoniobacterales bacterium]
MKFLVAQIGARRAYAVPAILEQAGMLERFYTNVAGNVGVGSLIAGVAALAFVHGRAERLAQRRIPESIRNKTFTFPAPGLALGLSRALHPRSRAAAFRNATRYSDSLGRAMARRGLGEATHVYSMLGECGPLLVEAKKRGLKVMSEVYILLSTERILAEERKRFPDWEPDAPDFAALRQELGDSDLMLRFSDHFICPSKAVRNDLVQNFGVAKEKTATVPYGMDPELFSSRNEPVPGRVLFAGTADLRKGIHYFAMSTEILAARNKKYEFRVAGNVSRRIAERDECRHLTFFGRVPRSRIQEEFRVADAFVLPSLAEGSAEVIYEALAAGVPVVTTPEAGSVVRDGVEGRIVPCRDPEALADAIVEVVEDREKHERMSHAARERAKAFTWERYGERLVAALRSLPQ